MGSAGGHNIGAKRALPKSQDCRSPTAGKGCALAPSDPDLRSVPNEAKVIQKTSSTRTHRAWQRCTCGGPGGRGNGRQRGCVSMRGFGPGRTLRGRRSMKTGQWMVNSNLGWHASMSIPTSTKPSHSSSARWCHGLSFETRSNIFTRLALPNLTEGRKKRSV